MEECKNWDGQSPPTLRHQLGKPVSSVADIIGRVNIVVGISHVPGFSKLTFLSFPVLSSSSILFCFKFILIFAQFSATIMFLFISVVSSLTVLISNLSSIMLFHFPSYFLPLSSSTVCFSLLFLMFCLLENNVCLFKQMFQTWFTHPSCTAVSVCSECYVTNTICNCKNALALTAKILKKWPIDS